VDKIQGIFVVKLGSVCVYMCIYIYIHTQEEKSKAVPLQERDHWGDLGVDGWIILGWISRRGDVGIWTGLGWPRIGTGGVRL